MAIEAERDPRLYPVDDDPMRAAVLNNGRPVPAIADPAPLGLAAFGITLMVFSMFQAGLLARSGLPIVLGLALAYGGIAQLLAGMWEFRRGNTFGAVVFGSYGAYWLSYWLLQQFFVGRIPGGERSSAIALFYISWAILTALAVDRVHAHDCSGEPDAVPADAELPAARHRLRRPAQRAGQDRRLVRPGVRRHGPLRRLRFGDEQHGRADAAAARAAAPGALGAPDGAARVELPVHGVVAPSTTSARRLR